MVVYLSAQGKNKTVFLDAEYDVSPAYLIMGVTAAFKMKGTIQFNFVTSKIQQFSCSFTVTSMQKSITNHVLIGEGVLQLLVPHGQQTKNRKT